MCEGRAWTGLADAYRNALQWRKEIFMTTATLTSKGQITIPASVRERLGIEAGDRIEFVEVADGEFLLKPSSSDVRALKGLLRRPKARVSVEAMRQAVRRRATGK
jgi:AbrB family looped-hinge helix DNA binding protein